MSKKIQDGIKAQLKIISLMVIVVAMISAGMMGNVKGFDRDDVIVNHTRDFDNDETNITIEIQNNQNLSSVYLYETNSTYGNQTELTSWTFSNTNQSQELNYTWTNLTEGSNYYYKVEVQHTNTTGSLNYYNVTKEIDFTESTGGGGLLDIDTSGRFDFLPDWWPSVDWDMSVYEGVARLWHFMVGLPILVVLGAIGVVYWWRR